MAQPLSLDSETSGAAKHLSLVGLLRERASLQADRSLYTLLIDGEEEGTTLSYFEVDQQARAIGTLLQSLEARGERALLVYPPGLEFVVAFYGCLYAGVIAVPTHITASQFKDKQSLLRFQAIVEDASPFAVLTVSSVLPKLKPLVDGMPGLSAARWIATDSIPIQTADSWVEPEISEDDLAFLQYTSGSTAYPKGVMVSHRNLLANLEYIDYGFEHTSQSLSLTWLPHFHDMGLINGFLQPLYKDFRCYVMSPAAFLQSPFRWLKAISRYRITHSGGPNFAYDLCLRKITEEQRATLDLSCWAVAFNGAEPIRRHTLEDFAEGFASCGFKMSAFYPAYGLAEATLKVTGGRKNSEPVFFTADASSLEQNIVAEASSQTTEARNVVGSGETACGTQVVIANPKSRTRCASNEVGEVWVTGPGVTRGYWNRSKENEETFRARLDDTGEGPFLRTGDLGFIRNGELFITGRLKDLIIIRGLNHYPQDIELTVERSHAALRRGGGAAFSIDAEGEERLVVVHELDFRQQLPNFQEVVNSIRQAIAENHQVQLYALALIKPGVLPKTTSGKVQRSLCRTFYLENTLDAVAHWQAPLVEAADVPLVAPAQTPEAIVEWLRSLLASKIGVAPSSIDVTHPITSYGVDSLTAIELGHHIQTAFGIVLSVSDLLASLSLSEVTARLLERLNVATGSTNLSAGAQEGEFPLSPGQQALWFLYVIAPQSIAYNIASAARIRSEIDVEALGRTFQNLVDRHAMLRTTFTASRGEPFQHVHKHREVSFDVESADEWSDVQLRERLAEEANCAFDLEKGPLFKVKLFSRAPDDHVLLLVVHHIVADMWSLAVLLHEFGVLYSAEKNARRPALEPLTYQYTDYVRWESEMLAGAEGERLKSYWQKHLADAQTVLDLPSDRPRSKMQSFRGDSVRFGFDSRLVGKLREVGQERGATLYMTLLAAFQAVLYRYTGKTDFLVGSPTSGRSRTETAEIVGYFVNPVVLRADFSGAPSFDEILRRVRHTVFDALDHDGYPFPLLVKQLQPERDPSRSPLFQVFFALQKPQLLVQEGLAPFVMGTEGGRIKLGELTLESMSLKQQAAQFDLSLTMTEMEGELIGSLDYNTDLFDQATIQRMAGHIRMLTESLIAAPAETISRLPMLTEAEQQLLAEWARTSVDYRQSEILPELLEQQARHTPEEIALVFEDRKLTYDDLNRRANQLAHWLQAQAGVGTDTVVGLLLERSVEMVVGLLGILKAGAAYMPLDPAYPQDRLSFMVRDARARLILTERRFSDSVAVQGTKVLCLDSEWETLSEQSEDNPTRSVSPDNLAYVIYTSGSTGEPKGVMNTHRAISNRLCWMQAAYELDGRDRVLQKTPFTFDVSVWEFFWPLITGARLVVARPGGHQDSTYLATLISEQEITTLHFVPSMLQAFLDSPRVANCRSLKRVICSGEALSAELQQRFFSLLDSELHNLYGPTEAAVDVTYWACEKESERPFVPIGRAIANIQIHIVDANLQPVPVGVPGELQIAGVGLARGYVNRPDLTAEKFIPDPFSSEPGARMYRTGDLTRYRPGGEIEFLGRIDHQVKVRGFRIELGEIEAALISHHAVREAVVVVAKESHTGDKRLVAYVVPRQEHLPELQAYTDAAAQSSTASAPDARREDAERRHKLPNGLVIAHDGDIQFNTMDIYREVFEKEIYLKHGVTLSDGDCVFDVGAHIGLFTLFVNEKCRNARVYAFEPIPPTFKVLRANVSIPGLSVKLFNLGLADRPGMDRFNYYPRMTGVSGRVADPEEHKRRRKPILSDWLQTVTGGQPATMLSERDLNDVLEEYFRCETYDCRLTTLSEVIRENKVERIDLLKIDVEESELDVLAGIRDEDWAKIKQIVLEVESREGLDAIVPMLKERGYEVFVDSVGYGFSAEDDAGEEAKSGSSTGYMIYSLRPQASEDQAREKPVEAAFRVLGAPPDSPLSVDSLRNHLLSKLPDYMTPSAFVLLDRMPLLSNGKVDRKALPAPEQSRRETEQGYVAPRNEVEQALAEILAEVLGLEKIGVNDDFFKFGGHSLLATQVMSRILEKFQVELPLQQLFEQPTVAGFAESVMNAGGFQPEVISPITKVNQSPEELLLAKIDQLTDEEVEALLGEVAAQDRREE